MLLVMGHSFLIFDHSIGKRYYLKCGHAQIWVWHSCSEYLVFCLERRKFHCFNLNTGSNGGMNSIFDEMRKIGFLTLLDISRHFCDKFLYRKWQPS